MSKVISSSEQISTIRAGERFDYGFFQTWRIMFSNIIRSRQLIAQLFKRDFLATYKKSFLGLAWIFILPVIGILSWVFLQKSGMLKPGNTNVSYPLYVLTGTSMWGIFIGFFKGASETLESGKSFLLQVHFPHEALLFQRIAQQIATGLIALGINIILLFSFGEIPPLQALLLPLVMIPMMLLAIGTGLILSVFTVVIMDIKQSMLVLIGLLMYSAPIIYTAEGLNPVIRKIIHWNPLAHLVCSSRDILLNGTLYNPEAFFWSSLFAFVVFLLSWRIFFMSENRIIERIV